ncbi:HDOD domain-containing protein [Methylomagnum ishizawai]|uniref:HDOD domain-containing protein n=1 Tax=Methylomagnum ishizawai TaxID=1760988 RepID=UPI001C32144E|nr:HDOD domain-containing protein [Methylomagnum ishizawai]BBL75242.1 HDOD domain-containing protein [Methylomagnum ishizawai]
MDLRNEKVFLAYMQAAVQSDKLRLPTLPQVALQVRQALTSNRATDAEIARLIANDPSLSVRLLQMANSPLFRARTKVESLQTAIARMGHNTVRTLVISLAMKQLFKPGCLNLDRQFQAIWRESVNVAAVCRALAVRCRHLDPDLAMLAGLLHQIGKLPILTLAEKFPELGNDTEVLSQHLEHLHPLIAKLIMRSWDLPEALARVTWEYLEFQRDPEPEADYVDVVQVAYLENRVAADPGFQVDLAKVPAFAKLGFEGGVEILQMEDISATSAETRNLLL